MAHDVHGALGLQFDATESLFRIGCRCGWKAPAVPRAQEAWDAVGSHLLEVRRAHGALRHRALVLVEDECAVSTMAPG